MCTAQQSDSASRSYRRALNSHSLCHILATITILLICSTAARSNHYDDVASRVRSLAKSTNVRMLDNGKSAQGRLIPVFVITDFSQDSSDKARVLLVAGQHGNEYNPVQVLLEYCSKLAESTDRSILERCIVIAVPAVNPDGIAANARFNADDVDINRDWQARHTPETRYLDSLVEQWRPHVILDMHEWTGPSDVPGNAIEVAHISAIRQKEAMTALASAISAGSELTLIQCSPHGDTRLFHRRYSEKGYGAFLLETAADLSYSNKSQSYTAAIDKTIETVTRNIEIREQLSPSAAGFDVAAVSPYIGPKTSTSPGDARFWQLAAILVAYCIIMWVLKPLASNKETTWSRRFVKCGIDNEDVTHPLIRKRKPQPLLYRSWLRRRIRARYLEDVDPEPFSETPIS